MVWNQQLSEWPQFVRDRQKLAAREERFLEQAGVLIRASRHISDDGRIGRAISEKALAQDRQWPVFNSLAGALLRHRKDYYLELELARRTLNADRWLDWFADIALEAQDRSRRKVDFMLAKTRLFDRLEGQLNERQEKALLRMFAEGINGFTGGLSAKNYMTTTGAPTASATRDLPDMVKKGALIRQGELTATRYFLNLD